uniref:Uncharacterized protein n=1 Tax=Candidatus Kentrum sp. FW TaxID=2126338 RepID=A0A450T5U3_9GAMM|nr:MAG: hypothetical protein BECKFW1821B_GA0114236_106915 [Candidatus Kentron sp. FW]VFJ63690.1 MAG: hypothetical protein BECKFW1821A_GA0114235_11542 [Candidatus Kentron sp. FW]
MVDTPYGLSWKAISLIGIMDISAARDEDAEIFPISRDGLTWTRMAFIGGSGGLSGYGEDPNHSGHFLFLEGNEAINMIRYYERKSVAGVHFPLPS